MLITKGHNRENLNIQIFGRQLSHVLATLIIQKLQNSIIRIMILPSNYELCHIDLLLQASDQDPAFLLCS